MTAKIAILSFNSQSGKWEASYDGQVFLKSFSKDYVVEKVKNRISNKAIQLGITDIIEVGQLNNGVEPEAAVPSHTAIHFTVQERFNFLADFVDMVATGHMPSCVVTGSGGLGKSYTVMKTLEAAGLVPWIAKEPVEPEYDEEGNVKNASEVAAARAPENAYVIIKGFSTAKGLYRTLYENRDRVIVFDDCDSILKQLNAINVLKAALDSYDVRIVNWNAEDPFGKSDLPKSFEFTGGVIFISNFDADKIPQAIKSRALNCDMALTRPETVERMRMIVESGSFMADVDMDVKLEALDYVAHNAMNPSIKALNMRTLIGVVQVRLSKPDNWERRALYSMVHAG